MDTSDRLYLSKLSLNADFGSLFEDDDIQNLDYIRDINQILGATDFDQMEDYLWDED